MKQITVSVTDMLSMTSSGARALLVLFVAVDLLLALANLSAVYSPVPTIAATVLVTIAAVALTLPAPEPFPIWWSIGVIAATTAATGLVNSNIPPDSPTSYASWHFGANTLLLLFLNLRGRTALAWVGFAAMALLTTMWTVMMESTALIGLLPNQAGTLVVGTLFAIGLRRTSKRITAQHAEQAALASAEAATRAAAAERVKQAAQLNAVARAALERIAAGAPFTVAEREGWMRLEASVRDSLRAPALNTVEIAIAADSARARGVEVTLFDDSAGALESDADRATITTAIVEQLSGMTSGRLIGRVLPTGRGTLATILVDDGTSAKRTDISRKAE